MFDKLPAIVVQGVAAIRNPEERNAILTDINRVVGRTIIKVNKVVGTIQTVGILGGAILSSDATVSKIHEPSSTVQIGPEKPTDKVLEEEKSKEINPLL